jgi:hypothetical protein
MLDVPLDRLRFCNVLGHLFLLGSELLLRGGKVLLLGSELLSLPKISSGPDSRRKTESSHH